MLIGIYDGIAQRLSGQRWRWVKADRVFRDWREFGEYLHTARGRALKICYEAGEVFSSMELEVPGPEVPVLYHKVFEKAFSRIYLPLGFANTASKYCVARLVYVRPGLLARIGRFFGRILWRK